ncbi:MAG: hypothetical protein DRP18_04910 [Candidatus Aenigmatarchaeota archaeon]|nr:MAG: hypothetical protein DRP18_04910 [Candidatus Aenigmarchaeota archaeon]
MNLKQYKKWLEEHANKEERQAYEVAKLIIDYHTYDFDYENIKIFPRKRFNGIEFDLLIYIYKKSSKPENRTGRDILIGVEFKENDMDKVIKQAIARKEFVDYMYIATCCRVWNVEQLFLLALYGIGWILWDGDYVRLILEPKRYANKVDTLINYLFDRKLREVIDDAIERRLKQIDEKIQRRLDEWVNHQNKFKSD